MRTIVDQLFRKLEVSSTVKAEFHILLCLLPIFVHF